MEREIKIGNQVIIIQGTYTPASQGDHDTPAVDEHFEPEAYWWEVKRFTDHDTSLQSIDITELICDIADELNQPKLRTCLHQLIEQKLFLHNLIDEKLKR